MDLPVREIVLLMTVRDAQVFGDQLEELRHEGETVVETVRRVVSESATVERLWHEELKQIVLCEIQAEKGLAVSSERGACPVHGGEECLVTYLHAPGLRRAIRSLRR